MRGVLEEEVTQLADNRLAAGLAGEEVGVADELGDAARGRLVVDLLRLADLLHAAPEHHGDLVDEAERLFLVVGNKDGSGARGAQDAAHLGADAHTQAGVKVGERLVEQHQIGFGSEGAGEGDALLLAAAEFVGQAAFEAAEAHHGGHLRHALVGVTGIAVEAEGDVLAHVEVREEGVLLEDHADAAALGRQMEATAGDAHAADFDAAAVERFEAGDQAQERGLAAAAGAEQGEQLALGQRQRYAVDGRQRGQSASPRFPDGCWGWPARWDRAAPAHARAQCLALLPVLSPIIGSPPGAGRRRSRAPILRQAAARGRRHGRRRLRWWPTRSKRRVW